MSSSGTGTGQANKTTRQTNTSAASNQQRASRQSAARPVSTPANSSTATNTRNASAAQGGGQSTGARKLPVRANATNATNATTTSKASGNGTPKRPFIPFKEDVEAHRTHRQTYLKLVKMLETRKPEDKPRVFVFTDVEQDYDDLLAVIFLAEMHRMGVIELVGFVANHQPAAKRARFLRTVLHLVNLGHIPVAVGTSGVEDANSHGADLFYGLKNTTFDKAPWNEEPFVTGAVLIPQVLRTKPNVTALMLSTLQDIGEFFDKQDKTADFKANNFSKFVSQGGYEVNVQQATQSGDPRQKGKVAARGNSPPQVKVSLAPVKDMANNKFHPSQAANYTNHIAAHKLPSDAWSREAAKAARLPGTFMKQLFKYGPIGAHLEWLWMRQEFKFYWDPFNWPFMDFLNTDWYLNTRLGYAKTSKEFKELQGTDLSFADAAPKIKVIAYDGCAAVGAVGDDFMRAMGILGHEGHLPDYNRPAISGHPHRVFGKAADKPGELNPENLGGINPDQLASVIETFLLGSLMATSAKAEEKIPRASIKHKTVPATVDVAAFKDKILLQRNAKIMNQLKEQLADAKAKKDAATARNYEAALRTRREVVAEAEARVKAAEGGKIVMPTRAQVPYEQLYEEAMRASKNQTRIKSRGGLAAVTAVAAVAAGVTKGA
ncbi:hypothetical protein F5144DRAFT_613848 [Chaetomium tenue]|uniref:Uncharacterized protein n=1 Tax=Chaetomium tenue TaxID=1854479 RepID=A0ACB7P262_9PEZI|nr:hypothetical protein F5144DRAFT_613848 [Chaetomium globosum]